MSSSSQDAPPPLTDRLGMDQTKGPLRSNRLEQSTRLRESGVPQRPDSKDLERAQTSGSDELTRASGGSGVGGSVTSRVSVLIPTHGDADLMRTSLPMFLADPAADIEVIIINNDPHQDVRRAIGDYASDVRITIVEMGYEGDFSRAINRGIRSATGDLIMLCNADLFPSPTYLATLQKFFNRRVRAGAATGKLIRYDLERAEATNVIDSAGLILTRQRRLKARGEGEFDAGQFDTECELFAIDGAAMVLRRAALDDIMVDGEYLDENFVAHKEDHDISWRLQLAGWECWYVPEAVAYHARTTRGLGSKAYLKAIGEFHRQQTEKTDEVRRHAMKNQWLLLLKNEDLYNFIRDAPFIISRELTVVGHSLVFSPRALGAIPMTIRILPETLKKRCAAKARQRMDAVALRRWIDV
jgi:GT2 family glycosyltransferase